MQAAIVSKLLEHQWMLSLVAIKKIRRANLVLLMDQHGQTALAEKTGIAQAQLYQMSKAVGAKLRNVSDARARLIEKKLGLTAGWMDIDHRDIKPVDIPELPDADRPPTDAIAQRLWDIWPRLDSNGRSEVVGFAKAIALAGREADHTKSGQESSAR